MMYIVHSNGIDTTCDAIETVISDGTKIIPAEHNVADGFKSLTIVEVSPSEQYYDEHLYVFPDHELEGMTGVDVGTYEEIEDE